MVYKFCILYIWSFQARIKLHPVFEAVIEMAIIQMIACQRVLWPNWFPEDQAINLRSVESETGFVAARTRLDDLKFKKAFYTAVSTISFIP